MAFTRKKLGKLMNKRNISLRKKNIHIHKKNHSKSKKRNARVKELHRKSIKMMKGGNNNNLTISGTLLEKRGMFSMFTGGAGNIGKYNVKGSINYKDKSDADKKEAINGSIKMAIEGEELFGKKVILRKDINEAIQDDGSIKVNGSIEGIPISGTIKVSDDSNINSIEDLELNVENKPTNNISGNLFDFDTSTIENEKYVKGDAKLTTGDSVNIEGTLKIKTKDNVNIESITIDKIENYDSTNQTYDIVGKLNETTGLIAVTGKINSNADNIQELSLNVEESSKKIKGDLSQGQNSNNKNVTFVRGDLLLNDGSKQPVVGKIKVNTQDNIKIDEIKFDKVTFNSATNKYDVTAMINDNVSVNGTINAYDIKTIAGLTLDVDDDIKVVKGSFSDGKNGSFNVSKQINGDISLDNGDVKKINGTVKVNLNQETDIKTIKVDSVSNTNGKYNLNITINDTIPLTGTMEIDNIPNVKDITLIIDNSVNISKSGTVPNGANGTPTTANGTSTTANGTSTNANGTSTTANGTPTTANGISTAANNTPTTANGTSTAANGTPTTTNGISTAANGTSTAANGASDVSTKTLIENLNKVIELHVLSKKIIKNINYESQNSIDSIKQETLLNKNKSNIENFVTDYISTYPILQKYYENTSKNKDSSEINKIIIDLINFINEYLLQIINKTGFITKDYDYNIKIPDELEKKYELMLKYYIIFDIKNKPKLTKILTDFLDKLSNAIDDGNKQSFIDKITEFKTNFDNEYTDENLNEIVEKEKTVNETNERLIQEQEKKNTVVEKDENLNDIFNGINEMFNIFKSFNTPEMEPEKSKLTLDLYNKYFDVTEKVKASYKKFKDSNKEKINGEDNLFNKTFTSLETILKMINQEKICQIEIPGLTDKKSIFSFSFSNKNYTKDNPPDSSIGRYKFLSNKIQKFSGPFNSNIKQELGTKIYNINRWTQDTYKDMLLQITKQIGMEELLDVSPDTTNPNISASESAINSTLNGSDESSTDYDDESSTDDDDESTTDDDDSEDEDSEDEDGNSENSKKKNKQKSSNGNSGKTDQETGEGSKYSSKEEFKTLNSSETGIQPGDKDSAFLMKLPIEVSKNVLNPDTNEYEEKVIHKTKLHLDFKTTGDNGIVTNVQEQVNQGSAEQTLANVVDKQKTL